MKGSHTRIPASWLAAATFVAGACSPEGISDTRQEESSLRSSRRASTIESSAVSVCHASGSPPAIMQLPPEALAGHRQHGDYVTSLFVNRDATGAEGVYFARITDALAAAREARVARSEWDEGSCRITIAVAPGTYIGSLTPTADPAVEKFPLVVNIPDVTIRGALSMPIDASGKATGIGPNDVTTTLTPVSALVGGGTGGNSQNIFVVAGEVNGPRGHRAVIEGFKLESGRAADDPVVGGIGILVLRAQGVLIAGNQFESGFASAVDLRASSGQVERIYLSGLGSSCDICVAGPGDYVVRDNRLIGGGIPGILILPAVLLSVPSTIEQYTLPATATVTALVENNEIVGHLRKPVGVGLRIGAVGVGAQTVAGTSKVTFARNNLVGNTFGIIVEAAFLSQTDPTRRRGDIELTTTGNTISGSCQNDVLVAMSNSQTALGIQNGAYLVSSAYTLSLGSDIPWGNVWHAHAGGTGNTLTVNGQTIPYGSSQAYDPTRSCT